VRQRKSDRCSWGDTAGTGFVCIKATDTALLLGLELMADYMGIQRYRALFTWREYGQEVSSLHSAVLSQEDVLSSADSTQQQKSML